MSEEKIRQAGVAGSFYPADPKVLSAMIDEMLAHATPPPIVDPILAVVAPHAGYQYSGPVAAYTYAALKGRKFSRVVVIAPSHYEAFDFTSVYEGDAYATPLGNVPVDKAFARQLAKMSSTMQLSSRGHDATSAGAENALEAWDYYSMSRNFQTRVWEACGGAPIVAAMIYAERMEANQALVLKYANSGDVTGDRSRVVGYSADVFVKTSGGKAMETPFSLSAPEKKELLALARKSVEYVVGKGELYAPAASASATLNQERGAFVTLTESGQLRGCIGYTSAMKPLYMTVRDTATHAALHDPRFRPVSASELPRLEYEVSVLSPLRRVVDVEQIKVGQHGLLMKNGDYEGLLLPQVPVEQGWDRQTFLEETCRKAGMGSNCWKDEETDIFQFTAVVFNEHEPHTL